MVLVVTPSGAGSVTRVELTNEDDKAFPVEVRMFRGDISETGELTLIPADDDFLVFPTQLIVPAKAQQAIRLQYVGKPDLQQSQIYYAAVRQIPVEMNGSESRVQVVVNFNILINVVPNGAKADPKVEVIGPQVRDAVNGVQVRVKNAGSKYMTAGTVPWEISGTAADGAPVHIKRTAEEMAKLIGVGVVAPGKSRVFFIPTDTLLNAAVLSVSMVN